MMLASHELARIFSRASRMRPASSPPMHLMIARAWVPRRSPSACCDGVHRGHRELIDAVVRDARDHGCKAVVVTFDPDPDVVVSPTPAQKLMTTADRLHALALTGVDAVVAVPFRLRWRLSTMRAFLSCCRASSISARSVWVATLG